MTCIVGMEFDGRTYIAGDIQGTGGNIKVVHTQPKVFRKNDIVFGYSESYRYGQVIEQHLPDPVAPAKDSEIYRWLVSVLIPDMMNTLGSHIPDCDHCCPCLVGVRGQLWEIQMDFSVLRAVRGYSAVGSGYEYALGSLVTSVGLQAPRSSEEVEMALRRAVSAASFFSPSVGEESIVIST